MGAESPNPPNPTPTLYSKILEDSPNKFFAVKPANPELEGQGITQDSLSIIWKTMNQANKELNNEADSLPSIGQLEQRMVARREDWDAIVKLVDDYFRGKIEATEGAIDALKKAEEAKKKNNNYIYFELPKPKEDDKVGPCVWLFRELIKTEVKGLIRGLRIESKEDKITYEFALIHHIKYEAIMKWFEWAKNILTNDKKSQGGGENGP